MQGKGTLSSMGCYDSFPIYLFLSFWTMFDSILIIDKTYYLTFEDICLLLELIYSIVTLGCIFFLKQMVKLAYNSLSRRVLI